MSEVRATASATPATRLPRTTAGPAAPVGPPLAPPPADQTPAVNVSGALAGGQSGERIEGIIIGVDAAGLPILRTTAGDFRIETAHPLVERSRLVLEIVHLTPVITAKIVIQDGGSLDPPPTARLTPVHAPGAQTPVEPVDQRRSSSRLRLVRAWPALEEALGVLAAGRAAGPLVAALPGANARLASAILFFVAALAQGQIESWLGPDVGENLTKLGRADLIAQLTSDFADLADFARGDNAAAWRAILLPLWLSSGPGEADAASERLQWPLTLFVRRSGEAETDDVRFVVDLPGTTFGPMQLDGLARTPPRLDLILRTQLPLPVGLQIALAELAERTGAGLGYPSRLIFEAVPQFPVNPLQDIGAGRALSDFRV